MNAVVPFCCLCCCYVWNFVWYFGRGINPVKCKSMSTFIYYTVWVCCVDQKEKKKLIVDYCLFRKWLTLLQSSIVITRSTLCFHDGHSRQTYIKIAYDSRIEVFFGDDARISTPVALPPIWNLSFPSRTRMMLWNPSNESINQSYLLSWFFEGKIWHSFTYVL